LSAKQLEILGNPMASQTYRSIRFVARAFGAACLGLLWCSLGLFSSACKKNTNTPLAANAQMLEFPKCEGAERADTDINDDGRADVIDILKGGVRQCSRYDFNFDGITDMIRVYSDGTHKMLEAFDHDRDGHVDAVAHYAASGEIERLQFDMDFDQRVDADFLCENGFVKSAKRARNRQGRFDAWESYEKGLLIEAKYSDDGDDQAERVDIYENGVLIALTRDNDRDGNPDYVDEIPAFERRPAQEPLRCEVPKPAQNLQGTTEHTAEE